MCAPLRSILVKVRDVRLLVDGVWMWVHCAISATSHCRSLQRLLETDNIQYNLVPVNGYDDLSEANEALLAEKRSVR